MLTPFKLDHKEGIGPGGPYGAPETCHVIPAKDYYVLQCSDNERQFVSSYCEDGLYTGIANGGCPDVELRVQQVPKPFGNQVAPKGS